MVTYMTSLLKRKECSASSIVTVFAPKNCIFHWPVLILNMRPRSGIIYRETYLSWKGCRNLYLKSVSSSGTYTLQGISLCVPYLTCKLYRRDLRLLEFSTTFVTSQTFHYRPTEVLLHKANSNYFLFPHTSNLWNS